MHIYISKAGIKRESTSLEAECKTYPLDPQPVQAEMALTRSKQGIRLRKQLQPSILSIESSARKLPFSQDIQSSLSGYFAVFLQVCGNPQQISCLCRVACNFPPFTRKSVSYSGPD